MHGNKKKKLVKQNLSCSVGDSLIKTEIRVKLLTCCNMSRDDTGTAACCKEDGHYSKSRTATPSCYSDQLSLRS